HQPAPDGRAVPTRPHSDGRNRDDYQSADEAIAVGPVTGDGRPNERKDPVPPRHVGMLEPPLNEKRRDDRREPAGASGEGKKVPATAPLPTQSQPHRRRENGQWG